MTRSTHSAVADDRNADVEIYINGEFFPRDEAKISVFDSGFLVGDGIWEGIRLHHGQFAFLDRHLDRLFAGVEGHRPRHRIPPSIEARCARTVERNDMHDNVHVRLMITRGNKKTPSQHPSNVIGGPNMVIIAEHKRADPAVADQGISLFTATVRRPPPDTLDQRLNCHSKLHEVIALIQAINAGADEALMLDPTGAVATCNATNFFIVSRRASCGPRPGSTTCTASPGRWCWRQAGRPASTTARGAVLADRRVRRRRGLRHRHVRRTDTGRRGRRADDRHARRARPDRLTAAGLYRAAIEADVGSPTAHDRCGREDRR